MVVTILGWTWWMLYFIACCYVPEGPLVGRLTQGEERKLNHYRKRRRCVNLSVHDTIKPRFHVLL